MEFKQWFEQMVVVGPFPYKQAGYFTASDYDVVINVSDEWYPNIEKRLRDEGCCTYWFPMNEKRRDIGLNSIYGAMVILHEAEQQCKRVYIHCHAGVNRSKTVWAAYYLMRSGVHIENPAASYINKLVENTHRGYLPPKAEMEDFLNRVQRYIVNMNGGILDMCKIESLKN